MRKKILLVDDDYTLLSVMQKILNLDYNVDTAKNGEEAVDKSTNTAYDIILLDINLGYGMNGFEVNDILKATKLNKSTPVIAFTADVTNNEKDEYLQSGFYDCLSKPFELSVLLSIIKNL